MKTVTLTGLKFLIAGAMCLLMSPLQAEADDSAGLINKGKAISQQHCSRCHVVGNYNPMGGISSTPSFYALVNYLPDWRDRFSDFYLRLPHPSVIRMEGEPAPANHLPTSYTIRLQLDHVDAILHFVRTLKK